LFAGADVRVAPLAARFSLHPDEAFGTEFLELLPVDAVVEVVAVHGMRGHAFLCVAGAGALLDDGAAGVAGAGHGSRAAVGLGDPVALVVLRVPNETVRAFLLVEGPARAVVEVVARRLILNVAFFELAIASASVPTDRTSRSDIRR